MLFDSVEKNGGESSLRRLHVVCAIIERDGLVLAAQRSASMSLPLKWEFPGGKIDAGESAEDGLKRELMEEMGIRVAVGKRLPASAHCYPTFAVTLQPFICSIEAGEIVLHEHAAIVWLPARELPTLDWAEADWPVLETYLGGSLASGAAGTCPPRH